MRRAWLALFLSAPLLLWPAPAGAEARVALVVGNGSYPDLGLLPNPPNDARLIAERLRALGFDVDLLIDANLGRIEERVDRFARAIARGGSDTVAFFYFAGHGVQYSGVNYLIPVDSGIETLSQTEDRAERADDVLARMRDAGGRLNFLVLDACRNNPWTTPSPRTAAGRGLAEMAVRGEAPLDAPRAATLAQDFLIAYATAPNEVALDGDGGNSPYTAALAELIAEPGLEVDALFRRVAARVKTETEGRQVPWVSSTRTDDEGFCFAGCKARKKPKKPPPDIPPP